MVGPNSSIIGNNYRYDQLDVPICLQEKTSKGIQIGENVWIGAGTVVVDGARIESGAIVAPNSVVSGRVPKPDLSKLEPTGRDLKDAVRGVRSVDFDESGIHQTTIYERDLLEPGMVLEGPCVVEEPAATLLVTPGKRVEIDDYGNIHIIMKS